MKGILGTTAIIIAALTAALTAALPAAPASAGTLYKCQGADGVTSYVSKRVAGAVCSSISYSRDTRPAPRPVVTAPKPAPATTVASIERNPVAVAASAATPAVAAPAPAPAPASVPTAATASRGWRAPLHQCAADPGGQPGPGADHPLQLHGALLRLRGQSARGLRHGAPEHHGVPERDHLGRARVRC
ncbi:hypothetical protein G6F63_013689 [Rhizopus arrhizus]|nr:hypothetical protein G6F63_013689 [Rhizopus arrhizus]